MKSENTPRYLWLAFYLLLNGVYACVIASSRELFGESANISLSPDTPVLGIGAAVCASYLFFCVVMFAALRSLLSSPRSSEAAQSQPKDGIGRTILILQLLFIAYFVATGTYVAGSTTRDASILSAFWVLVPVDMIFLAYYGMHRDGPYFRRNLVVWVVSSLIRGWTGGLLTVLFLEFCRAMRSGRLRFKYVAGLSILIVTVYPIIYYAKIFYRFAGADGLVNFVSNFSLDSFFAEFESLDLWSAILSALQQIFDRLQIVSSSVAMYQASPALGADITRGDVYPAWLEGIHGIGISRLSGTPPLLTLGEAFAQTIDPFTIDVNWNANPTLVGYLIAAPGVGPVLVFLYAVVLCMASILLMRLASRTDTSRDVVWYAWLVYLIPGWFGAFFLFIYAIGFVVALKLLLSALRINAKIDAHADRKPLPH